MESAPTLTFCDEIWVGVHIFGYITSEMLGNMFMKWGKIVPAFSGSPSTDKILNKSETITSRGGSARLFIVIYTIL